VFRQEASVRFLLFLSLPFVLAAQSPASDQQVTQALLSEIRELRLAIERSTLLNARTQLAISQLQLQETSIARLMSQLNDVRSQAAATSGVAKRFADAVADLEQRRTTATDPKVRLQAEDELKHMKFQVEQTTAMETARVAREGELAMQLQQAQNQIADSRARIAEMERALDAAIQQLLKK
jgi:hypothetical protein